MTITMVLDVYMTNCESVYADHKQTSRACVFSLNVFNVTVHLYRYTQFLSDNL